MKRSFSFFAIIGATLFGLVVQPLLIPSKVDAVTAADWQAGYIIDDAKFTSSSAMSVSQIQSWLNNRLKNCDPNGTRTSELSGGIDYNGDGRITRAEYGRSKGNPAPFTCLHKYYEVPKTSPGSSIPASNYGKTTIPSGAKSAAQLIYDAGKAYNISPKVLLVKLGTESAGPLTSDTWPFKSQYTYAMGAVCPDSGPGGSANCNENYAGFSIQMREAAKLLRWYLDNMNESWWPYKKPYTSNYILWNIVEARKRVGNEWVPCGGSNVYIKSKATAALYTYTPYQPNAAALKNMYGTGDSCSAYGNRNFWRVYNDWFGPSTSVITSYLSTCGGQKYLIEPNTNRKRLVSDSVAASWSLSSDSFAYNEYGCNLPTFDLELSNLVRSRNTGDVYFIYEGKAYHVANQRLATSWGLGSISLLPQVNGTTLHSYLSKIDKTGLTNIATSDNSSITTYYLLIDGKRYSIAGSNVGNDDVLRMVSGDTIVRRNTLPAGLLQLLPSTGTVDYHFMVNGELYVFDFGKIRKIESATTASVIQKEASSPMALHSSILNVYEDKRVLKNAFQRPGDYFNITPEQNVIKSDSKRVIANLSASNPESITKLLTSRLLKNANDVSVQNELLSDIRLIECQSTKYVIERNIRLKRSITDEAIEAWRLSDKHFFQDDKGCRYDTFRAELATTIRSRTTSKLYYLDDGIAYYVSNDEVASRLGLPSHSAGEYPQFEGSTINNFFKVISSYKLQDLPD